MDRLALLMGLRVRGMVPLDDSLASVVADGLAKETARGVILAPQGLEALDKLLADEGLRTNETLHECYERFLTLNARVLKVSTEWQVRIVDGTEVPNDHSDAHYDQELIDRLKQINDRVRECLEKIGACAPRLGAYGPRLDDCIARLRAGDRKAFTAPLYESYHTVWFELHQDLLLTLGLKREE